VYDTDFISKDIPTKTITRKTVDKQIYQKSCIAVPHNPEESFPIRIKYTIPKEKTVVQLKKLVFPKSLTGNTPYLVCRIGRNEIYLFPSAHNENVWDPVEHSLDLLNDDITITIHYPNGDILSTDLENHILTVKENRNIQINPEISKILTGFRIIKQGEDEPKEKVYLLK
jgi:hypothetical protein